MAKYTYNRLKETVEVAWGKNWREEMTTHPRSGFRTLAAILISRMGELPEESAVITYRANLTSTLDAAKKLVTVALNGNYCPLKLALSGTPGQDVCKIARDLRGKEFGEPPVEEIQSPLDRDADSILIELFGMFDQLSRARLLRMIPKKKFDEARKKNAFRLHPDRGGNNEQMARFNHLASSLKKQEVL